MKKTLIATMMVFAMGCASAQLEAQIDEQENMLLAKSKEVKALEVEIEERDKMIAELKAEMDVLEDKMLLLEADASYLKDLEYMHSELADEKMKLEDENDALRSKLHGEEYDKAFASLGETLEDPEGAVTKSKVETKVKTEPELPYPTVTSVPPIPPMMPPMAGMGMPLAGPMMPGMQPFQTFQSFPMSQLGYTYAPPPDNSLNIKISGEAVNEGTYFLVKVNGKEIKFMSEVPRPIIMNGKPLMVTLLPPEVDAFIPVDNTGPYTVTLQPCVMNGAKCVPNDPPCTKKVKNVQKAMVLARSCD